LARHCGEHHLDERIKQYDLHVRTMAQDCTAAKQLMQLMGAGVTTATTIMAMVGNAQEFDSGRQFADWLGLVPGQYSSPTLRAVSGRCRGWTGLGTCITSTHYP